MANEYKHHSQCLIFCISGKIFPKLKKYVIIVWHIRLMPWICEFRQFVSSSMYKESCQRTRSDRGVCFRPYVYTRPTVIWRNICLIKWHHYCPKLFQFFHTNASSNDLSSYHADGGILCQCLQASDMLSSPGFLQSFQWPSSGKYWSQLLSFLLYIIYIWEVLNHQSP